MKDQQDPKPPLDGEKRGPGRPPNESPLDPPLNVSPEALVQAVLRPPPKPNNE